MIRLPEKGIQVIQSMEKAHIERIYRTDAHPDRESSLPDYNLRDGKLILILSPLKRTGLRSSARKVSHRSVYDAKRFSAFPEYEIR